MTAFDKEEFWKSLGRLYDASVETRIASERLVEIAQAHESRLDRPEVVQEWLAEKERRSEKGEA